MQAGELKNCEVNSLIRMQLSNFEGRLRRQNRTDNAIPETWCRQRYSKGELKHLHCACEMKVKHSRSAEDAPPLPKQKTNNPPPQNRTKEEQANYQSRNVLTSAAAARDLTKARANVGTHREPGPVQRPSRRMPLRHRRRRLPNQTPERRLGGSTSWVRGSVHMDRESPSRNDTFFVQCAR